MNNGVNQIMYGERKLAPNEMNLPLAHHLETFKKEMDSLKDKYDKLAAVVF